MTKPYQESREKQMNQKIHGMVPLQHAKPLYSKNQSMHTENILNKEAAHHDAIQLLAYQIYNEKRGASLDNWLEAERVLKNKHRG